MTTPAITVGSADPITAGLTLAGNVVNLTKDELAVLNSPANIAARQAVLPQLRFSLAATGNLLALLIMAFLSVPELGRGYLDAGGPMLRISVNGRIYDFEMHPYCGPNLLNKRGDPKEYQPPCFLGAASLWAQQGKRMEDGLCRWDHEPEEIFEHLGGKHFKLIGYKEPKRGT